ncbi:MAG: ATP-binding cassette domain-containing protein [Actinomycetota bacterium]|nr:ATP-binding cassette domain-containing protein [Actinomycetota bacterium]
MSAGELQTKLNSDREAPRSVVSAVDVVHRYGQGAAAVEALRGVSLEIEARRLTAIMGPPAAGKSTLLRVMAGVERPTEGVVIVDGVDISGLSDEELALLRREKLALVPASSELLPMRDDWRAAVAHELAASRPALLFVDEAAGDGAADVSGSTAELLRGAVDELGRTAVMVTRDARAASIADRVVFLAEGRITMDARESPPTAVLDAMQAAARR